MGTEVLQCASLYSNVWLISERGRDQHTEREAERQIVRETEREIEQYKLDIERVRDIDIEIAKQGADKETNRPRWTKRK